MPELQSGDMIVEAKLWTRTYNYANGTRVTAHRVSSAWDTLTMTWNTKASYSTNIEDYRIVQSNETDYFWTVTGVVRDWYIGNYSNNGIMLKADVEVSNTYTEYYSSDIHNDFAAKRPALSIFYINSTGLEGYFDYESQSVGRAGTGHVNSFNGNLVFTHTGATTSGNKMPVSVVHVYNSNDRTTQLGYGNGWRTNYDQSVLPITIGGTSYLRYIDDTGTRHYFVYNPLEGKYICEYGKDLKITENTTYYTMKDTAGNSWEFYKSTGKLYKIKDRIGNFCQVNYSSGRISSITDGAGKSITFAYNASNRLSSITEPGKIGRAHV